MSEVISRKDAKALGLKWYFTGKPCKNGHVAEQRIIGGCRVCRGEQSRSDSTKEYNREYRASNAEKIKRQRRQHYVDNAEKFREANRLRYELADAEARSEYQRQYREKNADQLAEYRRRYAEENAEKLREMGRLRYLLEDPDKRSEYQRQYREANAELLREYDRQRYPARADYMCQKARRCREADPEKYKEKQIAWRLANPEKVITNIRNREARKRNAPGRHTAADIQAMYHEQGGCCRVCDASFDTVKYHVDHIVALANGGGNDPANLQLLCAPCNLSKGAKDFDTWWLSRMLSTQSEGLK